MKLSLINKVNKPCPTQLSQTTQSTLLRQYFYTMSKQHKVCIPISTGYNNSCVLSTCMYNTPRIAGALKTGHTLPPKIEYNLKEIYNKEEVNYTGGLNMMEVGSSCHQVHVAQYA